MQATNGRPILIVAGAAALIALLSMGVRGAIPLYQVPMVEAVGWDGRSAFAIAIAVQNLMWGISVPCSAGWRISMARRGCWRSAARFPPPGWR